MQTEPNTQPEAAPSATTHFTTMWGGLAIIVAGLIPLVLTLAFLAFGGQNLSSRWAGPLELVTWIVLAAGLIILAFGVRGEGGIVGGSRLGQAALVVLGLSRVALVLVLGFSTSLLSSSLAASFPTLLFDLILFIRVLMAVAAIISVVVIARARRIPRHLRWGAAVVVAWSFLQASLDYMPWELLPPTFTQSQAIALNAVFTSAAIIQFLLMIALGIGLALYGNAATLRRWRDTVNRNW